jgi:hypothetical protein
MAVAKKVKYANLVPMKEFGSMDAYLNPFPVLNRLQSPSATTKLGNVGMFSVMRTFTTS